MYEAIAVRPGTAHEVVELRPVVLGPRKLGMVRIRMLASTINPSDLVTISGAYPSRTMFPFVGGFEGVGEVIATDRGSSIVEGTRVIPIRQAGCWTQVRDVSEKDCIPVPDYLNTEQASFAYINPMTTFSMVNQYVTGTGPIIITAAASVAATQIAALLQSHQCPVIGIVRNSAQPPRKMELWTDIISTDKPGWEQHLYDTTGRAAQVVFDAVGGLGAGIIAKALQPGGLFVSYGLLSGVPIHTNPTFPSNVQLKYFHLRQEVHGRDPADLLQEFEKVFPLVASGLLATNPSARFPLKKIREALAWNVANRGKVLLELNPTNPK